MRKNIFLLLIITLLIFCCSCEKKDDPSTITQNPTTETEAVVEKPKTYSNIINLKTKYAVLSTPNYSGFENESDFLLARITAAQNKDWTTFSQLQASKGHTILALPLESDWTYSVYATKNQMNISQNKNLVADIVLTYGDIDTFISEENLIYLTDIEYSEHKGALYSYNHEDERTSVYLGKTLNGTTVLVRTPDAAKLRQILDKLNVNEIQPQGTPVIENIKDELQQDNFMFVDIPDEEMFLAVKKSDNNKYEIKDNTILITNNEKLELTVKAVTIENSVETLRKVLNTFALKRLVCVNSTNCFGYMFIKEHAIGYVGVDKNTGNGIVITGEGTQEQVLKILETARVYHRETTETTVNHSHIQKDNEIITELSYITEIALLEPEIYNEMAPYIQEKNYSCYVSSSDADMDIAESIKTNTGFMANDSWRTQSGSYVPAGEMRGFTITFHPTSNENGTYTYKLGSAIINEFLEESRTLQEIGDNKLYNKLLELFWDDFEVYANSHNGIPITVFVSVGENKNLFVYAQFGGLNP